MFLSKSLSLRMRDEKDDGDLRNSKRIDIIYAVTSLIPNCIQKLPKFNQSSVRDKFYSENDNFSFNNNPGLPKK